MGAGELWRARRSHVRGAVQGVSSEEEARFLRDVGHTCSQRRSILVPWSIAGDSFGKPVIDDQECQ